MAVQSFMNLFLYTCAPPSPPKAYVPPILTFLSSYHFILWKVLMVKLMCEVEGTCF